MSSASTSRATSTGPRLHDYSIPSTANGAGGVTQLRPGVLGVATKNNDGSATLGFSGSGPTRVVSPYAHETITGSAPVAVPNMHNHHAHTNESSTPGSWGSGSYRQPYYPSPGSYSYSSSVAVPGAPGAHPSSLAQSFTRSEGTGAWSASASSRSPSLPHSVDMDADVDVDIDGDDDDDGDTHFRTVHDGYGLSSRARMAMGRTSLTRYDGFSVKEEEEEDEMEFGGKRREQATEEEEWDGMDMDMEL